MSSRNTVGCPVEIQICGIIERYCLMYCSRRNRKMNWKFIRIAAIAALLLAAAIVTLAQSQTVKVRIDKAEYQFPDSDACIYFDWEAIGVLDHTLQLTLRAVQHGTGDFI